MNSNYTVDDVLQTAFYFVDNVDNTWAQLREIHNTVENLYFEQLKDIFDNEETQRSVQELLKKEFKKQDDIGISLEKNRVHLEGLKDIVVKLKEQKLEKENQLKRLETDIENIRQNIQSTLDDREDISRKKDIILAYKLLTNTSFVYTTKKVTGIVRKTPPKSFSFNSQESQEEISQKLWQLVLSEENK